MLFKKFKENFASLYFYGSLFAMSTFYPNRLFAQSLPTTNNLVATITGGWLGMIIQISIVAVALMEIMKELPDLLSGNNVWQKLAKIGAWVAIAIWWDDILVKLIGGSSSEKM